MPVFAELAAAAQVGHGEDAAAIEPGKQRLAELGRQADVEAAIAVSSAGLCPVSFSPLRMTRNIGTRVPSFDLYQTCLVS